MSVYFAQEHDGGPVKIGFAENPRKRVISLSQKLGVALRIVRIVDGGRHAESWFHEKLAHLGRGGEWFDYSPEILTLERPDEEIGEEERADRRYQARARILRQQLAQALHEEIPHGETKAAWMRRVSPSLNTPIHRIERHLAGETDCSARDGLAYFDHFGPDFEQKVRGA